MLREVDSMGMKRDFLHKTNYKYINMIGKGGFGKVWKVKHISTGHLYALKEMSKATYLSS